MASCCEYTFLQWCRWVMHCNDTSASMKTVNVTGVFHTFTCTCGLAVNSLVPCVHSGNGKSFCSLDDTSCFTSVHLGPATDHSGSNHFQTRWSFRSFEPSFSPLLSRRLLVANIVKYVNKLDSHVSACLSAHVLRIDLHVVD